MTFLNPAVLIGLAAAAIPILIHLLNLRKLRTIEFSSLAFLKDLQRTSIRRLKLRQLLLLAVRTLLIAAIVLAFARPALRGSMLGLPAGSASAAMAIILDDSPSMGLRNEQGLLFEQAREAVRAVVAGAGENDRITLLPLSEVRQRGERPAAGRDAVLEVLSERGLTELSIPYAEALERARQILADAPEAQREIYIVGDGQRTQFADTASGTPDQRLGVFVAALRPSRTDNVSAGEPELRSRILAPGRTIEVASELRNHAESGEAAVVASLYLDDARVAQQSASIPARGARPVELTAIARRAGIVEGTVRVDDDQMEIDNRSYVAVHIPRTVSVLLAGPAGPAMRYPELALTLGGDTSVAGRFDVTTVDEERLPYAQLARHDAVILAGVSRFAEAEASRLEAYVGEGGALVIFPGPSTDLENYNRVLFDRLGIPRATLADLGTGESFLSFAAMDVDHPVFAGMFEQPQPGRGLPVESPRIRRLIAPGPGGHPIITLGGGAQFLTEYRTGQGRVMLFGVDAGQEWSDFPFRGLYAPLLHQTILYLSGPGPSRGGATTGSPLELAVRSTAAPDDVFLLRSPSGIEERLVPAGTGAAGTVRFRAGPPAETGFYRLLRRRDDAEELLLTVAVNLPARESDLAGATREEMAAFLERAGVEPERIRWVDRSAEMSETVREARFGIDLWRHFLVLALVLALAEMIIGRDRRRAGEQ